MQMKVTHSQMHSQAGQPEQDLPLQVEAAGAGERGPDCRCGPVAMGRSTNGRDAADGGTGSPAATTPIPRRYDAAKKPHQWRISQPGHRGLADGESHDEAMRVHLPPKVVGPRGWLPLHNPQ